jgi:galactokinase
MSIFEGTTNLDSLRSDFVESFREAPRVYRAPARVNLIGEHTDYNDGFVMPAAIGFNTWVAASSRQDAKLVVRSEHFSETVELDLGVLAGSPRRHWSDYVRGVAAELSAIGKVVGANLLIRSDVPLGAGLSSSAALEVSAALALADLSNIDISPMEVVKLSQRAEHKFAGTLCGIMDQFVATFGQAGNALLIDCRSLQYYPVPIPNDVRLVICNSMVKHELASGEYNKRRGDCENGVQVIRKYIPGIEALRDLSITDLEQYEPLLSPRVYRRCRHVVTENDRAQAAARAMGTGDSEEFGRLMYASHRSLKEDYQVSCEELDHLVEIASQCAGVYGARMTGGGFGGCTVNLVHMNAVAEFNRIVANEYRNATGITPNIYICQASQGAGPIPTL